MPQHPTSLSAFQRTTPSHSACELCARLTRYTQPPGLRSCVVSAAIRRALHCGASSSLVPWRCGANVAAHTTCFPGVLSPLSKPCGSYFLADSRNNCNDNSLRSGARTLARAQPDARHGGDRASDELARPDRGCAAALRRASRTNATWISDAPETTTGRDRYGTPSHLLFSTDAVRRRAIEHMYEIVVIGGCFDWISVLD